MQSTVAAIKLAALKPRCGEIDIILEVLLHMNFNLRGNWILCFYLVARIRCPSGSTSTGPRLVNWVDFDPYSN